MKTQAKVIKLPIRNITLAYCNPAISSFGLESENHKVNHWDHCREQFAAKFTENTKGFYFSHKPDMEKEIVGLIKKFENVLHKSKNFSNFQYTKFAKTNVPSIIYIEPSPFWLDCYFKRSIYTLIVRCGHNYKIKEDNFDEALFGVQYKESSCLIDTKPAVMRFMFGFTKYTGISPVVGQSTVIKHGWKEEFHKLDEAEIKNRLVLPDGIKKSSNIVGSESIWT
jgi:hypothetical protein